eukprot:Hpha_TRINITY_DN15262_c0_g1::TRINITY_DN15262_c0_g1_i1::g.64259::m.64259
MAAAEEDVDAVTNFFDFEELVFSPDKDTAALGGSPSHARHTRDGQDGKPTRRELPRVVMNSAEYSSTLALLKRTREDVKEFAGQFNSLDTILQLPGSIELKRTIAKMFADPKNAEETRRAEHKRREERYEAHRMQLADEQADQMRKEQAALAKELEFLS